MLTRNLMCATAAMAFSPAELAVDNTKKGGGRGKNKAANADNGGGKSKKGNTSLVALSVVLRSTDPMLQHRMTDEARDNLPGGTGKLQKLNEDDMSPKEKAEMVMYRGPKNEFGIPAKCLFSALREAGKYIKIGAMQKVTNSRISLIPGFLRFKCEGGSMRGFLPFKNQSKDSWEVDIDTGRNPATGGRNCLTRPMFPSWEIELEVEFNPSAIPGMTLAKVREMFDLAGAAAGIGANRLNNQYGRFEVAKWATKELQVPSTKAA